jgi:pSer/pThr/pTyr-binding forkhead associated (FHA) protein
VDLQLLDRDPLRLSRDHFAIMQLQGRLFIRDLHSHLGTTVNGRPIGDYFGADEAPVRLGDNEIIAGGMDSAFVFTVRVAAGADLPKAVSTTETAT